MSTETAQINVRINRALKERGDAALEHAGYSPSQAIRGLWNFASRHAQDPHAIRSLIDAEDETTPNKTEDEHALRLEALNKDANICIEACKRLGIEPSEVVIEASYDELREAILLDRLQERSLDA